MIVKKMTKISKNQHKNKMKEMKDNSNQKVAH